MNVLPSSQCCGGALSRLRTRRMRDDRDRDARLCSLWKQSIIDLARSSWCRQRRVTWAADGRLVVDRGAAPPIPTFPISDRRQRRRVESCWRPNTSLLMVPRLWSSRRSLGCQGSGRRVARARHPSEGAADEISLQRRVRCAIALSSFGHACRLPREKAVGRCTCTHSFIHRERARCTPSFSRLLHAVFGTALRSRWR